MGQNRNQLATAISALFWQGALVAAALLCLLVLGLALWWRPVETGLRAGGANPEPAPRAITEAELRGQAPPQPWRAQIVDMYHRWGVAPEVHVVVHLTNAGPGRGALLGQMTAVLRSQGVTLAEADVDLPPFRAQETRELVIAVRASEYLAKRVDLVLVEVNGQPIATYTPGEAIVGG